MTEKDVRQTLASYLFRGRDASKRVADLSGGEKARLCLSELLGSRPNLLLLDEPTNHMDIPAKETLESAFCAYTGTILFVSHDRYFIRQVADAILVMDGDRVMYYPFGYDHYLERKGKGEGESLTALLRSEDQAMLESFRSGGCCGRSGPKKRTATGGIAWRKKTWKQQKPTPAKPWKNWTKNVSPNGKHGRKEIRKQRLRIKKRSILWGKY